MALQTIGDSNLPKVPCGFDTGYRKKPGPN